MTKNKIMVAVLAGALLLSAAALGGCDSNPAAANALDTWQSAVSGEYIGVEPAKEIALADAGLSKSEVTMVKAKLDIDDGRAVYDIEFYGNGYEYDYEIEAITGAIQQRDYETKDTPQANQSQPAATAPQTSTDNAADNATGNNATTAEYIGSEQAQAIALSHAGVAAADASYITANFDYEDGRAIYEVEFYCNGYEYDYDINALSGAVCHWDHEYDDDYYQHNNHNNNHDNKATNNNHNSSGNHHGWDDDWDD